MTLFLCKLWPYLAGGLIGWLLAGWLARRFKHTSSPVEKVVDNPKHLSLISKLKDDNQKIPDLVARIAQFESADAKVSEKIVEKEVEKIIEVDNPELLATIKTLEQENAKLSNVQSQLKALKASQTLDAEKETSQSEKEPEKIVDNPDHIKRIKELEDQLKQQFSASSTPQAVAINLEAAKAAGIIIKHETDLTAIEGIGPKINDLIHADNIQSFARLSETQPAELQTILDKAGPRFAMANPGTWPDQANLAANNRWSALKALQDVLDGGVYPDDRAKSKGHASQSKEETTQGRNQPSELDLDAAKSAGFKPKQKNGQDDFTIIEGIGPKINELIHDTDIHTLSELAKTYVEDIQTILDKAGPSYKLAKPGTWPAQAEMAASNKWDTLKAWQDKLNGGQES